MKAQSSVEFLILSSVMFLFFVGLVAVIGGKMVEYQAARNEKQVQDIIDVVKSEIQLAETSLDGYQRSFYLPETIEGKRYDIGLYLDPVSGENLFIIIYDAKTYETSLAGDITAGTTVYKGRNFITKTNGEIHIESNDPCIELTPGDNSYCIGGTCYCFRGFYDSQCDDYTDWDGNGFLDDETDGILEDDFVVDHCKGFFEGENYDTAIDCVSIDPCNKPPKFTLEPSVISGSMGERNVSVQFKTDEDLSSAVMNYAIIGDTDNFNPDACDYSTKLDHSSAEFGPFSSNTLNTITVDDLIPYKCYCFNMTIWDKKSMDNSSEADPTNIFCTTEDVTEPLINKITIEPELGYLNTTFILKADLDEPTGLDDSSRVIINRTFANADRGNVIKYRLKDDGEEPDEEEGDGIYTANFTVEHDFIDVNASLQYGEHVLFYNRFDNPVSFDADNAGGNAAAAVSGSPETVKARFGNGVNISSAASDELKYERFQNLDLTKGTIEFWIKTEWNGTGAGNYYLFDMGASTSQRMSVLKTSSGSNAKLFFQIYSGATAYAALPIGTEDLNWTAGEWYFVAATWDLAADPKEISVYINGNNEGEILSVDNLNAVTAPSDEFAVGYSLLDSSYQADAVMDHFVISDYAKTQAEILADMAPLRSYIIDLYLVDDVTYAPKNRVYYHAVKDFDINYTEAPVLP